MKFHFLLALISLSLPCLGWAQAGKAEDKIEDFLSTVSREDWRKMQTESNRKTNFEPGSTTRQVVDALRARGKSKSWTFVVSRKDEVIGGRGRSGEVTVHAGTEKDSFRFQGSVVFPVVGIEGKQVTIDKIKDVRTDRKLRVTGTIEEVMLSEQTTKLERGGYETRLTLALTILATDLGAK